jgi:hypothetical protein
VAGIVAERIWLGVGVVLTGPSAVRVSVSHGCQMNAVATPSIAIDAATAGINHRRVGAVVADSACFPVVDVGDRCWTGADCVGAAAEMSELGDVLWSARARAKSAQRLNRSLGSFASAVKRTRSRAVSSGRVSASFGGGAVR